MLKGILCSSFALGTGLLLFSFGLPVLGGFAVLLAVFELVLSWRFRYILPLDPESQSDLDELMRIGSSNGAAADEMRRGIVARARMREAKRLSQLRDHALLDRRAAVELRNRLREKIYISDGLRRRVERSFGGTVSGAALLQALDREASVTRQRWLEAEQFLQ